MDGPPQHAGAAGPDPAPPGEGRVLLVDDEEAVRAVARSLLERLGFAVVAAEDGAQAVERLADDPGGFVLVLLDLTMPRMGGEAAFTRLRALAPDIPVLFMSGYDEDESSRRFADRARTAFLAKPFGLEELRRKVAALLEVNAPDDARSPGRGSQARQ
jgi:CheY-like chemotaxis protein